MIIHNFDYNPSRQECRPDTAISQNHRKNMLRGKTKSSFLLSPSPAPGPGFSYPPAGQSSSVKRRLRMFLYVNMGEIVTFKKTISLDIN